MLASLLLKRVVAVGTLTVIDTHGKTHVFGGAPGPKVSIRLHDKALHHRLLFSPKLSVGESYMNGTLTIEEGEGKLEFRTA